MSDLKIFVRKLCGYTCRTDFYSKGIYWPHRKKIYVMLEPFSKRNPAMILEFKVAAPSGKKDGKDALQNAVQIALDQIRTRKHDAELLARGISRDRIRIYGFAFRGKEVLIGGGPLL